MTSARESADSATPWSCVSWRQNPSARRLKSALGTAIGVAVAIVLFSLWMALPQTGCSVDGSHQASEPLTPCMTKRSSQGGVEYQIPAQPERVTWGIGIAVAVVAGTGAYLFWPRRATALAWLEFERRSSSLRTPLAEQYVRTQDPAIGRQLEKFDADLMEIKAKYEPRR